MKDSEINEIQNQLFQLKQQLNSIEKKLSNLSEKNQTPVTKNISTPIPATKIEIPFYEPLPDNYPEQISAGNTLGLVAIVCFVLAAAFLIAMAINSGWLTPARQMGLSAFFGSSLIISGLWLAKKDIEYFSLLPAAGIIVLQLSAYGGSLYAHIYGSWQCTLLVSAISALSVFLYQHLRIEYYALIAVIGVYLCPLLLPEIAQSPLDFMTLFIVWDIAVVFISYFMKLRSMLLLASYMSLGVFSIVLSSSWDLESTTLPIYKIIFFQFVQFSLFTMGTFFISIKHRIKLTSSEGLAYLPVLIFFYAIEYSLICKISRDLAPWLALGFAAALYLVYFLAKKILQEKILPSENMLFSFISIVFFHAYYLELLPSRLAPWIGVLLLLPTLSMYKKLKFESRYLLLGISIFTIIFLEYSRVIFAHGADLKLSEWAILGFLYSSIFYWIYSRFDITSQSSSKDWFLEIIFIAYIQALIALHRLSVLLIKFFKASQLQGFATSILWGLLAISILLTGKKYADHLLAKSSLFIFAIVAGKVLILDVAQSSTLTRVVCLISLGIIFYFSGFILKKMNQESIKKI